MCGFVAIIERNGAPVSPRLLADMGELLAHRGPDDLGEWCGDNVGMHHRRLSIIDIEGGHQPMSKLGVTVVFNGEIYNYVELRSELAALGHQFDSSSDTEVLLSCYLQYGESFVAKLNGMFAFVLYDERRKTVMAARDHFGIKPLYRYVSDELVIYASEIKAILRHPEVHAELNLSALHDYVTFQHTLSDATFFKRITKVMPAHYEVFDARGDIGTPTRYWRMDYTVDHSYTEERAIEEIRELLIDSVRLQLRSDVPLGAYLSGGLDSSVVSVLAARDAMPPLQTFSGAFREGEEFDETRYARDVANAIGAKSHVIYPTADDFVDALPRLAYIMDEPAAGPGLFPQCMVSRLAADHVKVCLGGQGGDELFGGYARYPIAYLDQSLKSAIEGSSGTDSQSLSEIAPNLASLRQYAPLVKRFLANGFMDTFDRRYFALLDRSEGNLGVFSEDFRRSYDKEAVFARFKAVFDAPETDSLWNRMTHFDMVASLPALLQVEDRASMSASLESRVPLLDARIAELAARLPPALKWRGGQMKYLFRKAIKNWLPESVFGRTDKMGFPVPLHLWARGRARSFVFDTLFSQRCRERGLFDRKVVESLVTKEAAFGRSLWGLLQIELWCSAFMDRAHHLSTGERHAFGV
jgi:asparagine synthase (glutamine-hydrolysing)